MSKVGGFVNFARGGACVFWRPTTTSSTSRFMFPLINNYLEWQGKSARFGCEATSKPIFTPPFTRSHPSFLFTVS